MTSTSQVCGQCAPTSTAVGQVIHARPTLLWRIPPHVIGIGLPPQAAERLRDEQSLLLSRAWVVRRSGQRVTRSTSVSRVRAVTPNRRTNFSDPQPAWSINARNSAFSATPHAGYYTGPEHMRECVEVLDATRIGHGITAVHDRCVLDHLAAQAVALEICPTSYEPLGVLESGVPIAIGADNPLLFGTRLAGQYHILRDVLGFGDEQLAVLARHSIAASAAPLEVKQRLLADVDRWLG